MARISVLRDLSTLVVAVALVSEVGPFISRPALAAVVFPPDLLDIRLLADQIRSPFGLKVRDMRKAFGTRAPSPNQVDFITTDGQKISEVKFFRSLNLEKTLRNEETRLSNKEGSLLLTETYSTEGKALEFSEPGQHFYFDGAANYELLPNETRKLVVLRLGMDEAFRFSSNRSSDGQTTQTQVFYGGTLVLTLTNRLESNGTRRILEYLISGTRFQVGGFNTFYSNSTQPTHQCRVQGQQQSVLTAEIRMSCDGKPINTYADFSQALNEYIYTPLFTSTVQPLIAFILKDKFPQVVRPPNLATSGRFYTELLNMFTLLSSQPTLTNIQSVVSTLRNTIGFIQDGTIEIRDSRPAKE